MTAMKDFFVFCSGAQKNILKRTPTEINKYAGIGATIFFTGVFAAIAAGYALNTVFDNIWITSVVALLWGLMIFNLDRFIVSTMKKKGSGFRDFLSATPRIILAVLIAIVIAKPLEMKIFESEIDAQLVQMEQENFKEQDELIQSRYVGQIDSLNQDVQALKNEITDKSRERDVLVAAAIAEADGTGGSMRRNLGPIYRTKKAAADKVQNELDELEASNGALIESKLGQIANLESQRDQDLSQAERVSLTGFAARLNALDRAAQKSKAIFIANIFIMLLFICIEIAPVLTKLILERSPYDYVLDKHENKFVLNHKAITSNQYLAQQQEAKFAQETSNYKTTLAIEAEQEIAREAVAEKLRELKKQPTIWSGFLSRSKILEG